MNWKNKLFKDISVVISASAIIYGMSFIRSFTIPLLLSPSDLGQWNILSVVLGYAAHSHLGLLHGLGKVIPKILLNDTIDGRKNFKDAVFSIVFLLALCFSLIVAVFIYNTQYATWLLPLTVIIVMQSVYISHLSLFRADGDFDLYSGSSLIYAIALTVFVIGGCLCCTNSLRGSVLGTVLALFATLIYICIYSREGLRFRFDIKSVKLAFHVGLPQTLVGWVDMVVYTVDRWIVAAKFTNIELGYYGFACLFPIVVATIPIAISQVLYKYFLEESRNKYFSSELKNKIVDTIVATVLFVSILVAVISFFLPLLLNKWFPKYEPAVEIGKILVFGSFFFSLSNIAGTFLIGNDLQYRLIFVQVGSVILGIPVIYLLLYYGFGLNAVAFGSAFLYSFYGIGYIYLALFAATVSHVKSLVLISILFLPICFNIFFKTVGDSLVQVYKINIVIQAIVILFAPCVLSLITYRCFLKSRFLASCKG